MTGREAARARVKPQFDPLGRFGGGRRVKPQVRVGEVTGLAPRVDVAKADEQVGERVVSSVKSSTTGTRDLQGRPERRSGEGEHVRPATVGVGSAGS